MSIVNGYCTLKQFKDYIRTPGLDADTDVVDDFFIENIIEEASRRLDSLVGSRHFYPIVKTRNYDVPMGRGLWLGDDLLQVITLTNGDDTTIASTEYNLLPADDFPKYILRLTDVTSTLWEDDSNSSTEQVIALNAFWGLHDDYNLRAWKSVTTLNEGAQLSAADTTITMTSAANFYAGQIIKIENELMLVDSVSGNNVVVQARGENGSTAAIHADSTAVSIWQYPKDVTAITLEIGRMMYRSRYGENVETTSTVTAGGVIVTPRSLPIWAQEIIRKYKRRV